MKNVPWARRRMQERIEKGIGVPLTYDWGRFAESEFINYLQSKRVIIVGPAGYLIGQNKGEWINSFDVVVRVNHAIPITYPADYGSRTDVLYHILSRRNADQPGKTLIEKDEVLLWKDKIKWMVSRHDVFSRRVREMGPILKDGPPWVCIRHRLYDSVRRSVSRSPNTGIVAITHLLTSKLKTLHVIGFDFYQSGVYEGYGDVRKDEEASEVNGMYHDEDSQKSYMVTLALRDVRLKYDDHLRDILG